MCNSLAFLFSLYQQASDQGPSGDKNQKSKQGDEDSGEPAAKKPNSEIEIYYIRKEHYFLAGHTG